MYKLWILTALRNLVDLINPFCVKYSFLHLLLSGEFIIFPEVLSTYLKYVKLLAVPSSWSEECTTVICWWCSSGGLSTLGIVWRTLGIILRLIQFTTTQLLFSTARFQSTSSIKKKACKGVGKWVCRCSSFSSFSSFSCLLWSYQCVQMEMAAW